MFSGFRYRRGLSRETFALRSGLDADLVAQFEAYKRPPHPRELRDIATAFNVSVADLTIPPPNAWRPSQLVHARWVGPAPVSWDAPVRSRWGASPFVHWGYLRLKKNAASGARWYPVSAEQAWWLQGQFDCNPRRAKSTMIIGKTLNNRVLMFPRSDAANASLHNAGNARASADFHIGWDGDGLAPEDYRMLRAWAMNDRTYGFMCSCEALKRREELLTRSGLRRKANMRLLVDTTFVDRRSVNELLRVTVESANMQTALRSVPLGIETVYLAERAGMKEWLIAIEDIELLDMPALDVEEVRLFDIVVATSQ